MVNARLCTVLVTVKTLIGVSDQLIIVTAIIMDAQQRTVVVMYVAVRSALTFAGSIADTALGLAAHAESAGCFRRGKVESAGHCCFLLALLLSC